MRNIMTTDTDVWTKYKNIFLNREATIEIIHKIFIRHMYMGLV